MIIGRVFGKGHHQSEQILCVFCFNIALVCKNNLSSILQAYSMVGLILCTYKTAILMLNDTVKGVGYFNQK